MSEEIREEMSFAEMFAESEANLKPVFAGKVVEGTVTSITPNEVQVDIGTKHTGFVKLSELTDDPAARAEDLVKVGDKLDLVVEKVNDQEGVAYLSRKKLEARKGLEEVAKAAEEGTVMEGVVTETNKGGVIVLVKGVKVFVPRSQATMRRDEDINALVKQNVKLIITECAGRKIVGSINKVTAEENAAKREAFWADVEVGKTYTGVVKSLTAYGAFVDIGGVDGMVHISELSWSRIKHPSEVVSVGDTVEVYVISFDRDKKKISLGMKDRTQNPWEVFTGKYQPGDVANVRVVKLMTFGAFAEIVPGVDGLIHISQIADHRIDKPGDVLSEGQMVDVKIIDIDYDKQKVSLSIRALLEGQDADDSAESDGDNEE